MAEPFAEALSVGRAGDGEGSDEEREHVIRYVISTLRRNAELTGANAPASFWTRASFVHAEIVSAQR